jgi:serine/threonine protein kinase
MPFYTISLDEYILLVNETLTVNQLNKIMSRLISMLKIIHSHYVIHRDIKPQNFMLLYDDITSSNKELFIIDFGMATIYVDEMKKHLVCNSEKKDYVIGNPKFMSYNIHSGIDASRRDDLISIGYIYLYFLIGYLPWDTYPGKGYIPQTDTVSELSVYHSKNIYRMKNKEWSQLSKWILSRETEYDNIDFTNSILKIHKYLEHCYGLGFSTTPNYDAFADLFII